MTPQQVAELIEGEIAGDWNRENPHGVELRRCLVVPPIRRTYDDSFKEGQVLELWLVLEEVPDTKSGYKIVFDENREEFGLAIGDSRTGRDTFIGYYGGFLETLDGM